MIEITKRVSLDFLGEIYADSYLTLKSIPMKDFQKVIENGQKASDVGGTESLKYIQDQVQDRFVDGKVFNNGGLVDLTKDNLNELPGEVFTTAFQTLVGGLSPKV
jgi:hypothetical protein